MGWAKVVSQKDWTALGQTTKAVISSMTLQCFQRGKRPSTIAIYRRGLGFLISVFLCFQVLGGNSRAALASEVPVPNLTPTAAAVANASQASADQNISPGARTQQQLVPFYPYPSSVWEKFEEVRRNPQLEQLVQQDIENSVVIRQVIQDEVDRTFSHTTTLLNVLLVVLTAMPAVIGVGFWFLRRSVINQVLTETQQQLRQEVEQQFAAGAAAELTAQADAYQADMEALRREFAAQLDQLKSLFSDAQQEKDAIVQELSKILPSPMREPNRITADDSGTDSNNPELHSKVQALSKQLQALQQKHKELSFSADDYIAQAKALYFEAAFEAAIAVIDQAIVLEPSHSRAWFVKGVTLAKLQKQEEAIAAFEQAIKITPDFGEAWFAKGSALGKLARHPEALAAYDKAISAKQSFYQAWFGKARLYALQGEAEQAIVALSQAVAIEPERCRDAARSDKAFAEIKDNSDFQTVLSSPGENA